MEGGCYCGALRYVVEAKPVLKAQCHCRACSTFAGGAPNMFMAVHAAGFSYTKGTPSVFRKAGSNTVAARDFCQECGTQIASRRDGMDLVMVKIGTLDDPAATRGPSVAIFTAERQPYQPIPEGMPQFPALPG